MKTDAIYLQHILEAIDDIVAYTREGKDAFMSDRKTQDAVMRKLEIIGEAAKRLSEQSRSRSPEIAWRSVAGLRDVLIHNYMGVNLQRIWGVVEQDLPRLRRSVAALVNEA